MGIDTPPQQPENEKLLHGNEEVLNEEKRLEKIREKIKTEQQEKSEKQERNKIKIELQNIEHGLLRLSSAFRKREQDNLATLFREEDYSKISFAARSLSETVQNDRIDYEGITRLLRTIHKAFESYGTYTARGPVREDIDSLSAVSHFLRQTGNDMGRLRHVFIEKDVKEAKDTVSTINALNKKLEEVWLLTVRRKKHISEY
ncbi:hypothetical protein CL630_00210 [bacterium]|nr:hypothetical protein [bacterium]|tara:strand:+ start:6548 stop:7153 length:606 start_codon:yes stop_codon:yes gene_type:complete